MLLSDFLKNGSTLQGKAGALAINANDLLEINGQGQLFSANVSDYAAVANQGSAIVASTTVSGTPNGISTGRALFVNPVDLSSFILCPQGTGTLKLFKYSFLGSLIGSVTLDSTSSTALQNVSIGQLSNGNLVASWGISSTNPSTTTGSVAFAIVDINLNPVVARTVITTTSLTDNSDVTFTDAIPLSGGGFAVSYTTGTGTSIGIYSNTGSVVSAPANITSSPVPSVGSTISASRLAQLSNGNIAIAIAATTTSQALGHAIVSATGTSVLAYTVLDTATLGTSVTVYLPPLSAMTGFYCTGAYDATNLKAYVLSNAGALQGSAYSYAYPYSSGMAFVVNDGTNFWALFQSGDAPNNIITFLPASGSGYVTNLLPVTGFGGQGTPVYDRGFIVCGIGGVYLTTSAGSALYAAPAVPAIALHPVGDFCAVWVNNASNTTYGVIKYLNTAIVGISQATVAAGNAGTVVPFSQGPGGYPCNAIAGSIGKAFDHSATNIIGNKGTMLGNSVSLKGI